MKNEKAKHTPGFFEGWQYMENMPTATNPSGYWVRGSHGSIARLEHSNHVDAKITGPLISAAPELLEVLNDIRRDVKLRAHLQQKVDAAIYKAEGR